MRRTDRQTVEADGSLRVVEVNPARQEARPTMAARLVAMAEVLGGFGFKFQVFTEPDLVNRTR